MRRVRVLARVLKIVQKRSLAAQRAHSSGYASTAKDTGAQAKAAGAETFLGSSEGSEPGYS
jgi:hypothetical protein